MAFLTSCIRGGSEDARPGWLLGFDFRRDTILRLKRAIPYFGAHGVNREWREDETVWWVSDDYEHVLRGLFSNFAALVDQQGRLPL